MSIPMLHLSLCLHLLLLQFPWLHAVLKIMFTCLLTLKVGVHLRYPPIPFLFAEATLHQFHSASASLSLSLSNHGHALKRFTSTKCKYECKGKTVIFRYKKGTYKGFPAEYLGVEAEVVGCDIEASMDQDVLL